jgi:hypothetical protein
MLCHIQGKRATEIALLAGFSLSEIPVAQSLTGMLALCRFGGLNWPAFAKIQAKGRRRLLCSRECPFPKLASVNH